MTQEELRRLLEYNPESGAFVWRVRHGNSHMRPGSLAGSRRKDGYWHVRIFGKRYLSHRLAWFYVHGTWPYRIDHRDCNRSNNAIRNLRECSTSENSMNKPVQSNNSLKTKGVVKGRYRGYIAQIHVNKRQIVLGTFDTLEEAKRAYAEAAKVHFGEFARS
jgi:hypothetical protein